MADHVLTLSLPVRGRTPPKGEDTAVTAQQPQTWGQPRSSTPPATDSGTPTRPAPPRPSVPARNKPQRQRRRIWPWILALMFGFLLVVAGCVTAVVVLAQAPVGAANDFVALIDSGRFEAAYSSLCAETRESVTLEEFTEDLTIDGDITDFTLTPASAPVRGASLVSGTIRINDEPRNIAFEMTKENQVWRVCSYDPLDN